MLCRPRFLSYRNCLRLNMQFDCRIRGDSAADASAETSRRLRWRDHGFFVRSGDGFCRPGARIWLTIARNWILSVLRYSAERRLIQCHSHCSERDDPADTPLLPVRSEVRVLKRWVSTRRFRPSRRCACVPHDFSADDRFEDFDVADFCGSDGEDVVA